jgi:hypothetical protein
MPTPEPRPEFVDSALRRAAELNEAAARRPEGGINRPASRASWLRHVITRWETWLGAGLGGAVAAALAVFILVRPLQGTDGSAPAISLALHEARNVDVLVDSERDLQGATIRIALTGGVTVDGFENEREIQWQTNLQRGSNLLSLPLVGHTRGKAQLVAVIEHGGKTQRVTINLTVQDKEVSQS